MTCSATAAPAGTSADLGSAFRLDPATVPTAAMLRAIRAVEVRHKLAIGWPAATVARYYRLTPRHVFRMAATADELIAAFPSLEIAPRPARHA